MGASPASGFGVDTTAARVLRALESFDLKHEGGGQYRANSPFRKGSNSHAFTVVIDDGEHGAFDDKVSGEQGSLYALAEKLNIPRPERPPAAPTKRAYSSVADYETAHGAPAGTFTEAGWQQTMHAGRPALRIPTDTGARFRYIDGNEPAYRSPGGYRACWYRLKSALEIAARSGGPLVLCNGEASVVTAQAYGVAAACSAGGGEKTLEKHLLDALRSAYTGPVVIALDCDDKGRDSAPKLTAQLRSAGYDARAVDLQLSDKGDLADFCGLYHADSAAALSRCPALDTPPAADTAPVTPASIVPLPPATPRFKLLTLDDLLARPPVDYLHRQEIPARSFVVTFGDSGAGKSFVTLHDALSIAQAGRNVVFVAAEGVHGIAPRLRALCSFFRLSPDHLRIIDTPPNLLDDDDLGAFVAAVKPLNPAYIVLDTLARCLIGGDENSARDMGLAVAAVDHIIRETGATVDLVHHKTKSSGTERGSSALRGAADVMREIEKDADGLIAVTCSKAKNSADFAARYMRLVAHLDSVVPVAAEKVMLTEDDALTATQVRVLQTLAMPLFFEDGAKVTMLRDLLPEMKPKTVYNALSALKRRGMVNKAGKFDPFIITAAGLGYIALHTPASQENSQAAEPGGNGNSHNSQPIPEDFPGKANRIPSLSLSLIRERELGIGNSQGEEYDGRAALDEYLASASCDD